MDGLRHHRQMPPALRDRVDLLIDMSLLTAAELNLPLTRHSMPADGGLRVFVTSLDSRRGIPRKAAPILDVGFPENPHHMEAPRGLAGCRLTGCERTIAAPIERCGDAARFFARRWRVLELLLPPHEISGKIYSMIATSCTGICHCLLNSVERLTTKLRGAARQAKIAHRDLPPRPAGAPKTGRAALAAAD